MNIRNLKQNATVLDRNQMKSLTGGICASMVSRVLDKLDDGKPNEQAQANLIRAMIKEGSIDVDSSC